MLRYIIRRVVMALPTLILASLAIFLILHLIPGDPAAIVAGGDATPAQVAAVRTDLGLDKPLVAQYAIWIGHVLRGNFGNSLIGKYPVWDQIRRAYPATLELTIAAL